MALVIQPRPIDEVVLPLRDGREWRMVCTWGTLRRMEQRFGANFFKRPQEGGFPLVFMSALLYEAGVERNISFEEFEDLLPALPAVKEAAEAVLREAGLEPGELAPPATEPAP
jgi:hypothetical protein